MGDCRGCYVPIFMGMMRFYTSIEMRLRNRRRDVNELDVQTIDHVYHYRLDGTFSHPDDIVSLKYGERIEIRYRKNDGLYQRYIIHNNGLSLSDDLSIGSLSIGSLSIRDLSIEDLPSEDLSDDDLSSEDLSSEDLSSEDLSMTVDITEEIDVIVQYINEEPIESSGSVFNNLRILYAKLHGDESVDITNLIKEYVSEFDEPINIDHIMLSENSSIINEQYNELTVAYMTPTGIKVISVPVKSGETLMLIK